MGGWLNSKIVQLLELIGFKSRMSKTHARTHTERYIAFDRHSHASFFIILRYVINCEVHHRLLTHQMGSQRTAKDTTQPTCKYRKICDGQRQLCNTQCEYVCNKCANKLRIGESYPLASLSLPLIFNAEFAGAWVPNNLISLFSQRFHSHSECRGF